MKAAPFRYHRAATQREALELLSQCENAKILAGGQSLVPMMNMRYVMADDVIDINRIDALTGIAIEDDHLLVGAMTRQSDLLNNQELKHRAPIFADALSYVGHMQTRNRGTIGGSLAHMDPASELIGLASMLDATITVESIQRGRRECAVSTFAKYYFTPDIAPDELLTEVRFALPSGHHRHGFAEFSQRHGDFAIVGAAAIFETDIDKSISKARIVLIGVDAGPVRLSAAENILTGQKPTPDALRAAAETTQTLEYSGDGLVSAGYRKRLARIMTARALEQAAGQLQREA